jgi:hypothetical protein
MIGICNLGRWFGQSSLAKGEDMIPVRLFVVKHGVHWRVEYDNSYRNGFKNQKEALDYARQTARDMAAEKNCKVEVLVQSDKGLWHTDWTEEGE